MHEFELGVWRGIFLHLIRLLRTQGQEVVNELDAVKAAIMMEGSGKTLSEGNGLWEVAARGVETVALAARASRTVADAVPGALLGVLKTLNQKTKP